MFAATRSLKAGAARLTLAVLLTLVLAAPAAAIQLHWAGGGTNLTVSQATQAVLVVEADSAEAVLPSSWRLMWTADSSGIEFLPFDSTTACLVDTARVWSVEPPLTAADSASNQITAHFCSGGVASASIGYWILGLAGGSRGKLKVVAQNPVDSFLVVESNEATFNNGIEGEYSSLPAPVITSADYSHDGGTLYVQAIGSGLGSLSAARLSAPDRTWSCPLTIIAQTDSGLTATATTVASVPACLFEARTGAAGVTSSSLPEEAVSLPMSPLFAPATMYDPDADFYPRDFAFVYTPGKIHIIYIRHNRWERLHGGNPIPDDLNENEFGHQWTNDWVQWNGTYPRDTTVLKVTGATWDNAHVWAPAIVQQGLTFYMLYTGVHVDNQGHHTQGICLARSTDLDNWYRQSQPVWTADSVGSWADQMTGIPTYPYFNQQQFRDPFVMPDPAHPGKWLMYYTTVLKGQYPNMVVGVAQSRSDTVGGRWTDLGPIVATDSLHTFDPVVESPHVFNSHGRWWLMMTSRAGHPLSVIQIYGNPVDTIPSDSTRWGLRYRLYNYFTDFPRDTAAALATADWVASEYLKIGGREFIGAYDGAGIRIAQLQWLGTSPDNFVFEYPTASVKDRPDEYDGYSLHLSARGSSPVRGSAELDIEAPFGTPLRLVVYDVQGRCVKTLINGEPSTGRRAVRWDGKSDAGVRVRSGIYFAKLFTRAGSCSARLAIVR